ncbi:MAG: DoxX family protein [Cyanobacteria bacterium P01_H01_bin.21]
MTAAVSQNKFSTYTLLTLRIVLVAIWLYHGLPKAIFWSAAMDKFISFGLPGFLGPITGIAEVIAGLLFLVGRFWKINSLILMFIITGAIVTVQLPAFLGDTSKVAGLERDLMILAGHFVLLSFKPNTMLNSVTQPEVPTGSQVAER